MKKISIILIMAFCTFTTISAKAAGKTKDKKETKAESKKTKKKPGICTYHEWGYIFNEDCGVFGGYVYAHLQISYWCDSGTVNTVRLTTSSCLNTQPQEI